MIGKDGRNFDPFGHLRDELPKSSVYSMSL